MVARAGARVRGGVRGAAVGGCTGVGLFITSIMYRHPLGAALAGLVVLSVVFIVWAMLKRRAWVILGKWVGGMLGLGAGCVEGYIWWYGWGKAWPWSDSPALLQQMKGALTPWIIALLAWSSIWLMYLAFSRREDSHSTGVS